MDIFERIRQNPGPLGQLQTIAEGKFAFPKFEGAISNHIFFKGRKTICWSYNNYLGLANSHEIIELDKYAQEKWGSTYPMGSRMMTGDTHLHDEFERNISEFLKMESAMLLNFGYQGMLSVIDSLTTSNDVIISDKECHACIIDGIRLHKGKHLIYGNNDLEDLERKLILAQSIINDTDGGILLITEGVFSMSGVQGDIRGICKLKEKYNFRLLVDDAHGFGVMGEHGNGSVCAAGLVNEVDLYFTTFTKSMVSFGAVIAGKREIINYFKYNLRSQLFSKSLPMTVVYGLNERLKIIQTSDDRRNRLFEITKLLHDGLQERNLLSSKVNTCITPVQFAIPVEEVLELQEDLVENFGIYCSVIIYPVIPRGQVIFRMTPTSLHTEEDVVCTLTAFDSIFKNYI